MTMSYAELTNPETLIDLSQVELLLNAHGIEFSVDYADPFGYGEKHVFGDEGELMFSPDRLGRFCSLDVMEWIGEYQGWEERINAHNAKVNAVRK